MNAFKGLLEADDTAVVATVYDALSARMAQRAGFRAVGLSGYDLGAVTGVTEPLLTMPDVLAACRSIRRAISIPIKVDCGAGFGDPMHVVQLVEELKLARIDAMSIEDQVYPKRAHYFRDYRERTIPLDDMLAKIRWAKRTAGENVVVIGRTDAYKTDGQEEAVRRCRAFLDAGADAIMAFPNTLDEAKALPAQLGAPVIYVNTHGNRVGRPMLTARQAHDFGYALLMEAHLFLFYAVDGMQKGAAQYPARGAFDSEFAIAVRQQVEEILDVQRLYEIEEDTVERDKR